MVNETASSLSTGFNAIMVNDERMNVMKTKSAENFIDFFNKYAFKYLSVQKSNNSFKIARKNICIGILCIIFNSCEKCNS